MYYSSSSKLIESVKLGERLSSIGTVAWKFCMVAATGAITTSLSSLPIADRCGPRDITHSDFPPIKQMTVKLVSKHNRCCANAQLILLY
ncbi:hypothetical protein M0804_011592 [Polistes exclamans]|nr:hypothetical protein M0804_011592 [Polistes exclamans]